MPLPGRPISVLHDLIDTHLGPKEIDMGKVAKIKQGRDGKYRWLLYIRGQFRGMCRAHGYTIQQAAIDAAKEALGADTAIEVVN